MYLVFGRKAILSSTPLWNHIIYPPLFTNAIDKALGFLFSWKSENITADQKSAAYSHLYRYSPPQVLYHMRLIAAKQLHEYKVRCALVPDYAQSAVYHV